ncbi:hypothetical protein V6E00_07380 [Serratia marcescens]|uniref:hypothetical protein n=1 Tax=Serratia TaxID=613 RepID=UPI000B5F156E|nr:hypothetical protein [Serratia marcescens]ASM31321.1 hypothetical protein BVG84_10000 [Serratia marcescens]HBC7417439.1 hypothetical protein [Serratia marcescens]
MKTFNHVLPHRDEITVELLEGNVVQLTQANPSLDQPDQIKIHADDLPMLIDALTRASNVAKAEF